MDSPLDSNQQSSRDEYKDGHWANYRIKSLCRGKDQSFKSSTGRSYGNKIDHALKEHVGQDDAEHTNPELGKVCTFSCKYNIRNKLFY